MEFITIFHSPFLRRKTFGNIFSKHLKKHCKQNLSLGDGDLVFKHFCWGPGSLIRRCGSFISINFITNKNQQSISLPQKNGTNSYVFQVEVYFFWGMELNFNSSVQFTRFSVLFSGHFVCIFAFPKYPDPSNLTIFCYSGSIPSIGGSQLILRVGKMPQKTVCFC